MAYEVLMPQLGLTMEEGTVSQWLKKEGDEVKAGEAILEITTDKLTNEVVSEHDGVLLKIVAQEGDDIPVKGLLAYIGQPGEQVGDGAAAPAAAAAPEAAPAAAAAPAAPAAAPVADASGKRIRISPFARKLAAGMGVDYSTLTGSGPSGRIVAKDIYAAAEAQKAAPAAAAAAPAPAAAPAAKTNVELMDGDTVVKLSGMRKVVAERMLQSHTEIPPVTQNTKVDVTELMKFRKDLLAKTGKKYSVNDLVLKATAKVLRQHPEILVSYDGNQMIQHTHVNLGTPDEYKGSTFSVSNLGMFGIETFTPIVNQPNAAILGVCSIEDELQMDDEGNISKHQVMRLSFTLDHRLMDGAVAAKFAMDLRDLLQSPLNILL